jgi:hypothetical protein
VILLRLLLAARIKPEDIRYARRYRPIDPAHRLDWPMGAGLARMVGLITGALRPLPGSPHRAPPKRPQPAPSTSPQPAPAQPAVTTASTDSGGVDRDRLKIKNPAAPGVLRFQDPD